MKKRLLAFAAVLLAGIGVMLYITYIEENKREIPILNPNEINPVLVDSTLQQKGIGHTILPFELTNQDGEQVTEAIIENKIVVTDFFFTTCPSICPKMSNQLKRVQEHFKGSDQLIILSHTVWPEVDSVSILKDYAIQYDADPKMWQFLTGSKIHLYDLARKSYFVAPSLTDTNFSHGSENDFVHTENIVLVDAQKRIRGYYDGTDASEMDELILDIEALLSKN